MKVFIAIAATALLIGAGAAQAQNTSMSAGADMKADSSMSTPKHTTRHHRAHRHTTGIGSENNASARGSSLPGKDKLNSKGYLQYH